MEQLVVLLQKGTGAGAHRYREFMTDQKAKKEPRPHKPRTGHPRNLSSNPDRAARPGAHRYREFVTDRKARKKPRPHKPRTGHPITSQAILTGRPALLWTLWVIC